MKSFHRIICAAAVLLSASLNAFSQTPDPGEKVHVSTYVESFNYETMTGTVAIESFVENDIVDPDATVIPYDIVLVLDISSSMEDNIKIPTFNAQTSTGYSYKIITKKDAPKYYYYYDGEYYEVEAYKFKEGKTDYFSLRFSPDGGTSYIYLTGTGTSTTPPTSVTNQENTIWTGVLYTKGEITLPETRLDVMKEGAVRFVDIINDKSSATVDNRIAIVTYATNVYNVSNGLQDVYNNASTLESQLSALNAESGTYTGRGMQAAQGIIEGLSASELSGREQVVILFSDGDANDETEELNAVNAAYAIKQLGGTIYSIGLAAGMSDWGELIMQHVSSNYPDVQAELSGKYCVYTGDTKVTDEYYLETATGSDLEDIFAMIASSLDPQVLKFGAETEVQCEIASTLTLNIPGGASDIKAYTADCTGVSGDVFSFGDQTELSGLTVTVTDNGITTEGFDYSANWCGQNGSVAHGKELIIKVPFNFVPTSLEDKLDNIFAADKAPTLSKGTQQYKQATAPPAPEFTELIISKTGLLKGESAIFEINRAPLGTETADVPVNRIVLTGTDASGATVSHKIYFLNPDATYSVIEHTDWSWTYKPSETPQADGFIKQSKDMTTVPAGSTATLDFVNTKYDSGKLPGNAEAIRSMQE